MPRGEAMRDAAPAPLPIAALATATGAMARRSAGEVAPRRAAARGASRAAAQRVVLSCAHASSDMNQGALSAILSFLMASRGYDYATAAGLVMASNLVGSVVQPVFGSLADRRQRSWVMALGLLLAGGGMAATLVNAASAVGAQGRAVSVFSFGGNVGFTVGPALATAAIGVAGLPGMLAFFVPEVLITIAVLRVFGARAERLPAPAVASVQAGAGAAGDGVLADALGVAAAMFAVAGIALIPLVSSMLLPSSEAR